MNVAVLKVGGASTGGVAEAVAALRATGYAVCVVHGAGPQISEEMAKRGLDVTFVGGRRVTTAEGIEVVRERLAAVNAAVCVAIGADAVGLDGDKAGLAAEHGRPVPSAPAAVVSALANGLVPVLTPLARGPLNVNADEAASALAVGIGAARIQFLTDVPGVFHDGELVDSISAGRAESLVNDGTFAGGIVPKLLAAASAAQNGLVAEIGATAVVA